MRTALMMVLAFASTAAMAEDGKKNDAGDKGRLICRTEADIGTRLGGTRVCLTREQWAERQRQSREAAEHAQTGGQVNPSGG